MNRSIGSHGVVEIIESIDYSLLRSGASELMIIKELHAGVWDLDEMNRSRTLDQNRFSLKYSRRKFISIIMRYYTELYEVNIDPAHAHLVTTASAENNEINRTT